MADLKKDKEPILVFLGRKYTREILDCTKKGVRYRKLRKDFNYNDRTLLRRLKVLAEFKIVDKIVLNEKYKPTMYKSNSRTAELCKIYVLLDKWKKKNRTEYVTTPK